MNAGPLAPFPHILSGLLMIALARGSWPVPRPPALGRLALLDGEARRGMTPLAPPRRLRLLSLLPIFKPHHFGDLSYRAGQHRP